MCITYIALPLNGKMATHCYHIRSKFPEVDTCNWPFGRGVVCAFVFVEACLAMYSGCIIVQCICILDV